MVWIITSFLSPLATLAMRLFYWDNTCDRFSLIERFGEDIPPYLILSHTWGRDEDEITYKDIVKGRGSDKPGYTKLRLVRGHGLVPGLEYFWVDTCCIDKSSSAELSEAINSMYNWYRGAAMCAVFVSDFDGAASYPHPTDRENSFKKSRWFTRGWVSLPRENDGL